MGLKNIKMDSIMKETLVKIKDMELESFFTKIKQFMQENGEKADFAEKVLSFISLTYLSNKSKETLRMVVLKATQQ